jgi:putative transposase
VRRRTDDFALKISDKLARKYGTIVFEDLNIKSMVKNHSLASATTDSCCYRLHQFAVYKA